MKDVSAIVVNYGTPAETASGLRRLRESGIGELVLVDNGPAGEEVPESRLPANAKLLRNRENVGFAAAVNQGLCLVSLPYVLLINPDAEPESGAIEALAQFMRQTPNAGMASAMLIDPDGGSQPFFSAFPTVTRQFLHMTGIKRLVPREWRHPIGGAPRDMESPFAVDWAICAACLLRRDAVERIGGLDERFFVYGEDMDLCYRLRRQGWSVHVVPKAVVRHQGSPPDFLRNGRSREAVTQKTTQQFFAKHYGVVRATMLRGVHLSVSLGRLVVWSFVRALSPSLRGKAATKMTIHAQCVRQALR